MTITIRKARPDDVDALCALNAAAYPDLVEDDVVFQPWQYRLHMERFPAGQLVAVDESDRVLGSIATLIAPRELDCLSPHTWLGVTDGGTFARHDPGSDTLYLADVYVHPDAWGKGVGRALYQALFDLCREYKLARVVGGGRLYDFVDTPEQLSPEQYVADVIRGTRKDRVLISQLRAGFQVRGLLPGYLHDWRSRHVATLIVWDNPDVTRVPAARAGDLPLRVRP